MSNIMDEKLSRLRNNRVYLAEKISGKVAELLPMLLRHGLITEGELEKVERLRYPNEKSFELLSNHNIKDDDSYKRFIECLKNLNIGRAANVLNRPGVVVIVEVKVLLKKTSQSIESKLVEHVNLIKAFNGPKKDSVKKYINQLAESDIEILEAIQQNESRLSIWLCCCSACGVEKLKSMLKDRLHSKSDLTHLFSKLFNHLLYVGKRLGSEDTVVILGIDFDDRHLEKTYDDPLERMNRTGISDIINCTICLDPFDDPRALPCLHTFCLKCLEPLGEDSEPGEELRCPICRASFVHPKEGFTELPRNFLTKKVQQRMSIACELGSPSAACSRSFNVEMSSSASPTVGLSKMTLEDCTQRSHENQSPHRQIILDTITARLCESCAEENPTETPAAVKYCADCEQSYCDVCFKDHNKTKKNRSHRVVDIETAAISTDIERSTSHDISRRAYRSVPGAQQLLSEKEVVQSSPMQPNSTQRDHLGRQLQEGHEEHHPIIRNQQPRTNIAYLTKRIAGDIYGLMGKLQSSKLITREQRHDIVDLSNDTDKTKAIISLLGPNDSDVFKRFMLCLKEINLHKSVRLLSIRGVVFEVKVTNEKTFNTYNTSVKTLVSHLNDIDSFNGPKAGKVEIDLKPLREIGIEILEAEQLDKVSKFAVWFIGNSSSSIEKLKQLIDSKNLLKLLSDLFKHLLYKDGIFHRKCVKPIALEFDAEQFEHAFCDSLMLDAKEQDNCSSTDELARFDSLPMAIIKPPEFGEGHQSSQFAEQAPFSDESSRKIHRLNSIQEFETTIQGKSNQETIMEMLRMSKFYPKALSLKQILELSENIDDSECLHIVKKIIMLDKSALLPDFDELQRKCSGIQSSTRTIIRQKSLTTVHPMDVLNVILNCCDNVLLQILIEKLFMLQLSIPLIFPDYNQNDSLTCLLWSLRGIVPECKISDGQQHNLSLVEIPTPFVSFIRIGKLNQSKSMLINSLFRSDQCKTFFHRRCKNGKLTRTLSHGTIEATWFQPFESTSEDMVGILNLRGEASKNPEQILFLCTVSSLICLMVDTKSLKTSNVNDCVNYFRKTNAKVMLCFIADSPEDVKTYCKDCSILSRDWKNEGIQITDEIYNWSEEGDIWETDELKEVFTEAIKTHLTAPIPKNSLETLANIARGFDNCYVEEDDPRCVEACEEAKRIFNSARFDTIDELERKSRLLPLQGKLWQEWADIYRKQYRGQDHDNSLEEFIAEKEAAKTKVRQEQFKLMQNGSCEFVKSICLQLQNRQNQWRSQYFLISIRLILDEYSRKIMPKLLKNCENALNPKRSEIKSTQIESNLFDLEKKLLKASFGIENIFREFGQMFEVVRYCYFSSSDAIQNHYQYCLDLPRIMASLLLEGFPLELMDGDTAFVPVVWIKTIFEEIQDMVGEEKKLYVVSIVGVQSSGKSTFLNTMFGLKFPVSAGRCTKGVYCQLIPVDRVSLKVSYDYMLVIDTEGLRAPEIQTISQKHDNQLATFVIGLGNTTIVNLKGENLEAMQDILQIVIHAMIRIKYISEVQLNPSCIFIHQNVAAANAEEKLKVARQKSMLVLDKVTEAAAIQEKLTDVRIFKQVIDYDENTHAIYLPDLWIGEPPMAPVNPRYSEKISRVKELLIKNVSGRSTSVTFSSFATKLVELWESILCENFVFSFKNSEEIRVYSILDDTFSRLLWNLKKEIVKWQQNFFDEILSCQTDISGVNTRLKAEIKKTMATNSEAAQARLKQYFTESTHTEILAHWEARYQKHIVDFCEDENKRIDRKLDEYTTLRIFQIANNETIKDSWSDMIKDAKQKAGELKLKQANLNENELDREFDRIWNDWISKLDSFSIKKDPVQEDILAAFSEDLHRMFNAHRDMLQMHLQESPLSKLDDCTFSEFSSPILEDLDRHGRKLRKKIADKLTHLIKPSFKTRCLNNAHSRCQELSAEIEQNVTKVGCRDFRPGYATEIIQRIQRFFKEMDEAEKTDFMFQHRFRIQFTVYTCKCAANEFIKQRMMFREATDPLLKIKENKTELLNLFKNEFNKTPDNDVAFNFCANFMKTSIRQTCLKNLNLLIAKHVTENNGIFESKRSFLSRILIDLGEGMKFQEFVEYFENQESFLKKKIDLYIRDLTKQQENVGSDETVLRHLIEHDVRKLFRNVHFSLLELDKNNYTCLSEFLWKLESKLKSEKICCPTHDTSIIKSMHVSDFAMLHKELINIIPILTIDVIEATVIEATQENRRSEIYPDIRISDKVMGCLEKCPLCGSPCAMKVTNHAGNHWAHQHYPLGVKGIYTPENKRLHTLTCQVAIDSDIHYLFQNGSSDLIKNYKEYHPDWEISSERSTDTFLFWKWFMAEFNKDLAEYYELQPAKIPKEWCAITWEQARENLRFY